MSYCKIEERLEDGVYRRIFSDEWDGLHWQQVRHKCKEIDVPVLDIPCENNCNEKHHWYFNKTIYTMRMRQMDSNSKSIIEVLSSIVIDSIYKIIQRGR